MNRKNAKRKIPDFFKKSGIYHLAILATFLQLGVEPIAVA